MSILYLFVAGATICSYGETKGIDYLVATFGCLILSQLDSMSRDYNIFLNSMLTILEVNKDGKSGTSK